MIKEEHTVLWDIYLELRKEILKAQEIRAKSIGFKISFISALIGFVIIYRENGINQILLIIPVIASVFFDLLINVIVFL